MMNRRTRLVLLTSALVPMGLCFNGQPRVFANGEAEKNPPSIIRVTPPAPAFDDAKRIGELATRRKHVADTIGTNSILILFSAEPRVYTNDVDYQFRQENNLYYLTNLKQKGATLVLLPGNSQMPEILFLPRRNPAFETWTGHMFSAQEAAQVSGIKEIWEASEFGAFITALRNHEGYQPKPEHILLSDRGATPSVRESSGFEGLFAAATKNDAALYMLQVRPEGESREYRQEQRFAADWAKNPGGFTIKNAFPIFAEMRVKKSPMELEIL